MPVDTQKEFSIKLTTYHDCDNVYLCWRAFDSDGKDMSIDDCLGFKIERQRYRDNTWQPTEILRNRVGFENEKINQNDPTQTSKSSSIRPFQLYSWTDHGANYNETIRYRIAAMKPNGSTVLGTDPLTEIRGTVWTEKINVTADAGEGISVFFNRGTVMSQYVAWFARKNNWSAADIPKHIAELEEPLRVFLSGELRNALIKILDDVIATPSYSLYAALYELSDKELLEKLYQLKSRANIVLSDGTHATKRVNNCTVYDDENKDARDQLKKEGVNVFDRMLKSKGLGHNKFFVVVDNQTDTPRMAWLASLNWTPTGLCTQLNNGVLFDNPQIASVFYEQWKKLKDAGDSFPMSLVASNNQSPRPIDNIDVWFTRVSPATPFSMDIAALKNLVDEAKHVILYVMFEPGPEPLKSIIDKGAEQGLYVRGVVSTLTKSNKEQFTLYDQEKESLYETELIQPEGVGKTFSWWIKEVTRGEFIPFNGRPGIGHAITHTKMFVVDPFSDKNIIVTGSHNFSKAAATKNDESFVVIRNNRDLAQHYAVACMSIYDHYHWRAYLKEQFDNGKIPWNYLSDKPAWQSEKLGSNDLILHLNTWCPDFP